jgi:hypothetical protein
MSSECAVGEDNGGSYTRRRCGDVVKSAHPRTEQFIAALSAGDDDNACEHQDCPENDALVYRLHLAQKNNA